MNKLKLILILLVILTSCSLHKKTTSSKSTEVKTVDIIKKITDQSVFTLDTSKSSDSEVVYKKTEYYPPTAYSVTNPTKTYSMYTFSDEPEKGSVKSEETLTVKTNSDQKGKTEVQKNLKSDSTSVTKTEGSTNTVDTDKPAPDPKRWMWIFGIVLLLVGGFFYLKSTPFYMVIEKFFKSIFSKK